MGEGGSHLSDEQGLEELAPLHRGERPGDQEDYWEEDSEAGIRLRGSEPACRTGRQPAVSRKTVSSNECHCEEE